MDSVMGRDGACMEKKGIEYRVLVRKLKQNRPLGRPMHRR
jgi:hypothetical protein